MSVPEVAEDSGDIMRLMRLARAKVDASTSGSKQTECK